MVSANSPKGVTSQVTSCTSINLKITAAIIYFCYKPILCRFYAFSVLPTNNAIRSVHNMGQGRYSRMDQVKFVEDSL